MTTVYLTLPPGARVLQLPASWDAFAYKGLTYRIVPERGIRRATRQKAAQPSTKPHAKPRCIEAAIPSTSGRASHPSSGV